MAKKTKFELDSFEFDRSLDMPEFDFDVKIPKDTGKPITRIGKATGRGFLDTIKSSAWVRNTLTAALPRGFGSALEFADQSARSIKDLYDSGTKELKPQLNELRRITQRVLPKDSGKDTELMKKLRGYADKYEKPGDNRAPIDPREQNVASVLGEVFGAQQDAQSHRDKVADIKDNLREGLTQARHKDVVAQLDAIRLAVTKTAAYTTSANANYQRKSLEIQYRSYFMQMDMLAETKRANAIVHAHLDAIMKNTALPDIVKLNNSPEKRKMMRNRFIGGAMRSAFDQKRGFARDLVGSLQKQAQQKIVQAAGGFRQGINAADMLLDSRDMAREMGIEMDPLEMGGEMAGQFGANQAGQWLARKLYPHLNRNTKIRRGGNLLQYGIENMGPLLQDWAKSGRQEGGKWSALSPIISFLKQGIKGMPGVEKGLDRDNIAGLQEPATFDRHVSKSITDIIPGYLARIYRELQVMRTGDEKTELTEYDHTKNRFDTRGNYRRNMFKSIITDDGKKYTTDDIDRFISQIGGDKLTAEQKKAFGKQMLHDNVGGKGFTKERLTNPQSYVGGPGEAHAKTFANLFKDHLDNDPDKSKLYEASSRFNALGRYTGDSRELVQRLVHLGQGEALQEMGIVNAKGDLIDVEKLYSYYYGDGYEPGSEGVGGASAAKAGFTINRGPRRKRRAPIRWAHETAPRRSAGFTMEVPAPPPHEGYEEDDPLIKAVREASSKAEAIQALGLLERIALKLETGIPSLMVSNEVFEKMQAQYDKAMSAAGAGVTAGKAGARTLWGHATHFGSKGFGLARNALKDVRARGLQVFGKPAGWLKDQTTHWAKVGVDKARGFRDVYIKGEVLPRITAWKLKAGEYKDQATGKVIEKWSDISGAVVDLQGNIVMTAEEAKQAIIKSGIGEKTLKAMGAALQWGKDTALEGITRARSVYGMVMSTATSLIKDYLDGPADVYVKGRKDGPQLLARLMRAGEYFDAKNPDKKIKKIGDIEGPVAMMVDGKPEIQLTAADIKAGLLGSDGKPLRTGMDKLVQAAHDTIMGGFGLLQQAGGIAGQALSGVKAFMGKLFGTFVGKDGLIFSGGKQLLSTVEQIRDLLDERLPGRKLRVGSVEDLNNKRKAREDEEAKDDANREAKLKGEEGGVKGLGPLGKLFSMFKKKKGEDDEKKDGEGGVVDDLESGAAQYLGEKATGKFGRLLSKIPGVGRLFGKKGAAKAAEAAVEGAAGQAAKQGLVRSALGGVMKSGLGKGLGIGAGLGVASSLANATGHDTIGSALNVGSDVATGWGLASGAAGLLGIEGGALGLAGAVGGGLLTAIGAIAASPVLLAVAGTAAVGAGGYMLYKHFTKNNLDTLSKMRYVQYGFDGNVTDYVSKVFDLEDLIAPGLVFKNGVAGINDKKVDWKKALEGFDVDTKDTQAVNNWISWFAKRFKPVYLTAVSVLNTVKPGTALKDVDSKLNNSEKKKYFSGAKYASGPYGELTSPVADLKTLPSGPEEVKAVIAATDAVIGKLPDDKKDAKVSEAGLAADFAMAGIPEANLANPGAAKPGATLASSPALQALKTASLSGGDVDGVQSNRGLLYVAGGAGALNQGWNGRVDAVSAIRFKAYGLKDMDADKVSALSKLEDLVDKGVSFSAKKVAGWNGKPEDIIAKAGPSFGVDGVNNTNGYNWMSWFNLRFLPTYLNYRTALRSATGKDDADGGFKALKPQDSVGVAQAVLTTTSRYNGTVTSVWQLPMSPWPGYELNAESATTDGNMKGLKDAAQTDKLAEQTAFERKTSAANSAAGNQAGSSTPQVNEPTSIMGKIFGTLSDGNKRGTGILGGLQRAFTAVGAAEYNQGAAMTGGSMVDMNGQPTGGQLDNLPMPKGIGWANTKDLIYAAAKMAGVDPKLMATMAAIESGFNWQVKAGTSSATGLFQFINSTWQTMLKKYGPKYGIPMNTQPTDPRASALMGAEFIKENAAALKGVKPQLTDTDLYLAHFLGAGGAKKLLSASPNANAVQLMPDAARANAPIFMNNGQPRTVAEVYAEINRRVRSAGSKYGLGSDDGSEGMKPGASAAAQAASAGAAPDSTVKGNAGDMGPPKFAKDMKPGDTSNTPGVVAPGSVTGPGAASTGTPSSTPAQSPAAPTKPGAGKPVIPVADTTPASGTGGGYLGSVGNTVASAAMSQGVNPRSLQISSQQKSQAAAQAPAQAEASDVLNKQLEQAVQTNTWLSKIFEAVNKQGAAQPATAGATADAGTTTQPAARQVPQQASKAPISMARRTSF
jgi:hypothetical protein